MKHSSISDLLYDVQVLFLLSNECHKIPTNESPKHTPGAHLSDAQPSLYATLFCGALLCKSANWRKKSANWSDFEMSHRSNSGDHLNMDDVTKPAPATVVENPYLIGLGKKTRGLKRNYNASRGQKKSGRLGR